MRNTLFIKKKKAQKTLKSKSRYTCKTQNREEQVLILNFLQSFTDYDSYKNGQIQPKWTILNDVFSALQM